MTIVYYKPSCSGSCSRNMNNPITTSKYGMPEKFRGADGGASFSMGRNLYINTNLANETYNIVSLTHAYNNKTGCRCRLSCNHISCTGCNNGKSINVQSSDQYIQRKKNKAIGKGSMPVKSEDNGEILFSFRSQNLNTSRDALRKCRSGGTVAPAKKGARPVSSRCY